MVLELQEMQSIAFLFSTEGPRGLRQHNRQKTGSEKLKLMANMADWTQ
jgi:hypothetical protein